MSLRTPGCVCADMGIRSDVPLHPRGHLCVRADATQRPREQQRGRREREEERERGGEGEASARTPMSTRTLGCVCTDMGVRSDVPLRPRGHLCVRADICASAQTQPSVRADSRGEGGRGRRERGGEGDASARTPMSSRMQGCVRADMGVCAQTHGRVRADSTGEGGRGEGREMSPCEHGRGRMRASTQTRSCLCGRKSVRVDALLSARMHGRVRADAPCFTPGNFKKDATVRPSHGRPRSHHPTVRPSVQKRPRDNPACSLP
jgi:hypothetical protein